MFYVIGNVYRGRGFTWIVETLPSDSWKYSRHGEYETLEEAEARSEAINKTTDNKKEEA